MMQKLGASLVAGVLLLASGCDIQPIVDRVLPLTTSPTPKPTVKAIAPTALEKSIHEQVNQYRASKKLPPLKFDDRIAEQSRIHSQNMAKGQVPFSHDGFEQRVKAIGRTIFYRAAAENVAYNFGFSNPGKQAVEGWIKSPGHRKNMEGNFNLTGIGIAKNAKGEYYFTQVFILK